MKQNKLPKLGERTLFEKIVTCLIILFAIQALIFIILETANVNVPQNLDSLFIYLELICFGILNYKYNKRISVILFIFGGIALLLTLIKLL